MRRYHLLFAFALILLIFTGLSIFGTPKQELVCSITRLPSVCTGDTCISVVIVKVGNTGLTDYSQVTLSLPRSWPRRLLSEPRLLRFGILPVLSQKYESDSISFGPLEATKWVELKVSLRSSSLQDDEECKAILAGHPGELHSGSPEFLRFGRFLYRLLTLMSW